MRGDGFKSRKLWLVVFSQALVLGFALLSIKSAALVPLFATFCGTVTGLAALYLTGNVAEKHVLTKNQPKDEAG